jgi:Ca-activated chloride channel homolog
MMPAVEIIHPRVFLLAAVALPLLGFWFRRSLDPLTPRRRKVALLLRGLVLLLLLAALADIRWVGQSRKQAAAWLIDVSDSVGDAALDKYRELLESGQVPEADINQRIPFAGTFRLLEMDKAVSGIFRDDFEPDRTRLDRAARFAAASLPADHVRSLFLLTDGNSLPADWDDLAGQLHEANVRIFPIPVSRPDSPEVLAAAMRAPQTVRRGEPFQIEIDIVSNRPQPAELQLFRSGVRIEQTPVELAEGLNRFELVQTIDRDSLTEFTARIEAEGDTFLDNNERSILIHAAGEPKVMLVTDAPDQARFLHWALRQEGIELEIRPPEGAPTSLNDLQNFELLVLDNIPATDLSLRQLELYAAYVDDFGGGFLMLGGDQSFGLGGYHRTPVDDILPLRSEFEMDEEAPSLGLALVIDKSGSMSGERMDMAIAAAQGAVELLAPSDYVGVVVFDGDASWAAEMQSAHNRDGLIRMIGQIQAGGGTNLAPAMDLAHRGLAATPSKIKHAIILSDGHSQPGDFSGLTAAMALEGITVSTLGVGHGTDVQLLQSIARLGNGRFYFTDNNRDVPQIMARETMAAGRSAIDESPFLPVLLRRARFLDGIDFGTAPFLYGHVKTEPRATARRLAGHRARQAAPGHLAVRPRQRGGIHFRRPQPVGGGVASLGRVQPLLGATVPAPDAA